MIRLIPDVRDRTRRAGLLVRLCVYAAVCGAAWWAFEGSWVLGPKDSDFVLAWARIAFVHEGTWALGKGLGAPEDDDGYRAGKARVRVRYGFALQPEGGPPGLRRWFVRESIWIQPGSAMMPFLPQRPRQADLEIYIAGLAPEVLTEVRASGGVPRVTADAPVRWRLNRRGLGAWWAQGLTLALSGAAVVVLVIHLMLIRRGAAIMSGRCPRCDYVVAGLAVTNCPECGLGFTLHDQSVLATRRPA